MENFKDFLRWEELSKDTIDVKRIYIDIAGDLVTGILLSQIIYWNLPNKEGTTRLRVHKNGQLWLAKGREDWYEECRITPKQFDRASKILVDKGIIEKQTFKFDSNPTVHIRLIQETFLKLLNEEYKKREHLLNKNEEKKSVITQRGKTNNIKDSTEGKNVIDQRGKTDDLSDNIVITQRGKTNLPTSEDRNLPMENFKVDQRDRSLTEITTENINKDKNDDDDKINKEQMKKNYISIFHQEIIEECKERNLPQEEIEELLTAIGDTQYTFEALDATFEKVIPKYMKGEISSFGKYFAQVLKREQRRIVFSHLMQSQKEQAAGQNVSAKFPFYNWLEE